MNIESDAQVLGAKVCTAVGCDMHSDDTLNMVDQDFSAVGESLTGDETIISKGGIFELGFFKPVDLVKTVVWVANRDNPVLDPSTSKLKLFGNGNLVILNQTEKAPPIWSANSLNATEAVLGDDGNLVLRDGSNPSLVIWQSFDYPTDTWLPGGKIRLNKKTKEPQLLTSWRNQEDPAPGIFTLELDPAGTDQTLIRRNKSEQFWRSGLWDEQKRTFSLLPSKMTGDYTDTMKCECLPGFVERSPSDWDLQDSTGGCARNTSLQCGNKDVFLPMSTSNLPENPHSPQVNGVEECKLACESTCTCNAYAYRDSECQLWDGDMLNVKQQSDGRAGNLYLKLSAFDVRSRVLSPAPITEATVIGVLGCIYLFKRNKASERGKLKRLQGVFTDFLKTKATHNDITLDTNLFNDCKTEEETQELQIFNRSCLAIATNNYSWTNKLGEGGFGPVHMGKLQNGQEIAVKRLSQSSGQGIIEFKNEILLISKLKHRNLVKLLGCCIEGDEKMLIYEYMPNKSLDTFLFDPKEKASLDWDTRFNIIGGIARGASLPSPRFSIKSYT
ncbi:hypothetical protein C5167_012327 [Papaver somniferum]|uniref:non-specific serine/threonine protein kinase n=1 Tax=Papaver somniferum TaxID=3469 RepID=A0A4Y7J1E3_PAPSO|nr:hypothetical protein C5167_012327 [Papaver somniferum]